MIATAKPPIIPRPLHDELATIRALARQMLADLDRTSINTFVPTPTLELLLNTLCAALDRPVEAQQRAAGSRLFESATSPQVEKWWRDRAEADEE